MNRSKKLSRGLFWLLFLLVCYIVFAYPVMRLLAWSAQPSSYYLTVGGLLWLVGVVGWWYSFRDANMKVRYVIVHWMGVSFIMAMLVLVSEPLAVFFAQYRPIIVCAVIILTILLSMWAVCVAHSHRVIRIALSSKKLSKKIRIVQVSDVHIGSRQKAFLTKLVKKVNDIDPDFVVITGDLIDSKAVDYSQLVDIASIKAETYFTIGNHERYAGVESIQATLQKLGVTVLRQQAIQRDELTFLGIDDADNPNQVATMLPDIGFDKACFNVLLYHKPQGWESAFDQGVDLMLSGHTHHGQIFPFNFVLKGQFKLTKGLHRFGEQHIYINQGSGTWGPTMRLGTVNEITVFELMPTK